MIPEVFDHLSQIKRIRADDLNWQSQIAMTAKSSDKQARRRLRAAISALGRPLPRPGQDMYTGEDDNSHLLMVGSAIAQFGDSWVNGHPEQIEWLHERGVTAEMAVSNFREWTDEQRAFPGWTGPTEKQLARHRDKPKGRTGP